MSEVKTHPASLDLKDLAGQCDTQRTRRSGPGGQNRNKVETAIVLRHRPTGIQAEANERRSQAENLREAYFRLRVNLALEVRHSINPEAPPTPRWQARLRKGQIAIRPDHDDFPAILAEALDMLEAMKQDYKGAAHSLQCTSSQLVRLLKLEPRALARLNQNRKAAGLHPIY